MKILLLTGITALFLATGTAHAEPELVNVVCEKQTKTQAAFYRCVARWDFVERNSDCPARFEGVMSWTANDAESYTRCIARNAARLPDPFAAFWRCIAERRAGKVKHCYQNDERWRGAIWMYE